MATKGIKKWIEVEKLNKQYKKTGVYGYKVQAPIDDGGAFIVVHLKENDMVLEGGLKATKKQVQEMRKLGMLE